MRWLGCLRGLSSLTGFALAVEIGDWDRFTGASIGAFVGLTSAEYSSGTSRTLGPITKNGNRHVRRLLVEAAWHHRARYRPGKVMRNRWARASAAAQARGDQGNRRLHQRWVSFLEHRKRDTVANTAIAREMAGWYWPLATLEQP
ncbi:transposase [Actinoplanes sp. CA-030573]|uniref:transposase n=1 Tax=Actinoplanes sp. CA-030573 TaxID=3239898 RepID=UPI003D8FCEB7